MCVDADVSSDLIADMSRIVLGGWSASQGTPVADLGWLSADLEVLSGCPENHFQSLLTVASTHHVLIRLLQVITKAADVSGNTGLIRRCSDPLISEQSRISHALNNLTSVCDTLEAAGVPVTVIKSLEHWPDLGSDLDLYTSSNPDLVIAVMKDRLHAEQEQRSWGDRLAGKWNFRVPGLPELVEIHVQRLGQTGEQRALAQRVIDRRVPMTVQGISFQVPAPEEKIIISTLQRMYRHFYFRLCDIVDFARLLQMGSIDFTELQKAAELGRIWPGVAGFLFLVSQYATQFGAPAPVPSALLAEIRLQDLQLYPEEGFLRIPKSSAAGLFRAQLLGAGIDGDLNAAFRLSLLPPLALSALVAFHLTGNDKGVW